MTGVEAITTGHSRTQQGGPELAKLKQSTRQVVGSVFYGTLMQTMRDSNLKGPYGHGGRGEEVFSAQLHNMLAEKMGQATNGGLADALYDSLRDQQERMAGMNEARRTDASSDPLKEVNRRLDSSDAGLTTKSLF